MEKVEYCIFNPGGNITALVFNNHYEHHEKKIINDIILNKHSDVEQVGFIGRDEFDLQMAGGEFCGNATRCAVKYYIKDSLEKEISIKVSGMKEKLISGINGDNEIWVDIPIKAAENTEYNGIDIVKLDGITHIVFDEKQSKKYLKKKELLKEYAKKIIDEFKIDDSAVGVLFTEKDNEVIKLYPIVWVKEIDTLFFETACGSGTVAVSACSTGNKFNVFQPSGYTILGEKIIKNNKVYIKISGVVMTDGIIKTLELGEI